MLEAFVHQQRLVYRDAVRLVREAQKLLRAPDLDALTEVAIPQVCGWEAWALQLYVVMNGSSIGVINDEIRQ